VRVALYDDPLFREHDAGPEHPERPERLEAVRRGLRDAGLEGRLELRSPRPATREELRRVHSEAHIASIEASRGRSVRFDPDTAASPRSAEAALRAAGAVVDAVDRLLGGDLDRAFCAVRPPGHHAEAERAMGFCLYNNVAVGAAHALSRGLDRVLIVDFDVHHGNGTQSIFYDDPRVLYVSSHAFPFYPGTGSLSETGEGEGRGFTVNLPLPGGAGDAEYAVVYREIVEPLGKAFDPQLVLVSAGFDPFVDDPLAGMRVTAKGFAAIARSCLETAAGAAKERALFVLEGGYDLDGIAASSAAVVREMLKEGSPEAGFGPPVPGFERILEAYRRVHGPTWGVLTSAVRRDAP
jgi:acetoin utilization deacetylase AcuC-like enzyme